MSPPLRVLVAGRSATGPVRERNEDQLGWVVVGDPTATHLVSRDGTTSRAELVGTVTAVVAADGLGGHPGGDVASRAAVRLVLDAVAGHRTGERMGEALRAAFERANGALIAGDVDADAAGRRFRDPQTTLTALVLTPAGMHLAHVGDCRIFRLRDGLLELLTRDHTQAMEMLRMRIIRPEQVARHPGRHLLTRSIGGDLVVRVDVQSGPVRPGDTYLVATDGAWSGLDGSEIHEALLGDLDVALGALVERSLGRDGNDNASVIALRVLDVGTSAAGEAELDTPGATNGGWSVRRAFGLR